MKSSQSAINQAGKPWLQYSLAISFGIVAFAASLMFSGVAPPGSARGLPLASMVLSGLLFSVLGIFAMGKDTHKGFGVTALAAGSVIVGIAPLIFQ